MSTLALSPHLDDVVFSAGAKLSQLNEERETVTVLTVFAGEPSRIPPFARSRHELWQLDDDAVSVRQREDQAACRELGARAVHWQFEEAIYREDLPERIEVAEQWICGMLASRELADEIVERLASFAEREHFERVLVPLAIGKHVDHRLTRRAAERVFSSSQRLYYEDYPARRRHRKRWRALWPPGQWKSAHLPVDDALLAAKCRAARCYRSQLRALAPAREIDRKLERDFSRLERYWRERSGRSRAPSP